MSVGKIDIFFPLRYVIVYKMGSCILSSVHITFFGEKKKDIPLAIPTGDL